MMDNPSIHADLLSQVKCGPAIGCDTFDVSELTTPVESPFLFTAEEISNRTTWLN